MHVKWVNLYRNRFLGNCPCSWIISGFRSGFFKGKSSIFEDIEEILRLYLLATESPTKGLFLKSQAGLLSTRSPAACHCLNHLRSLNSLHKSLRTAKAKRSLNGKHLVPVRFTPSKIWRCWASVWFSLQDTVPWHISPIGSSSKSAMARFQLTKRNHTCHGWHA